jgi:hypothetical protein
MLIWKVIAANPGITRAQIWERIEHSIPAGYARRMYAQDLKKKKSDLDTFRSDFLPRARGFVLTTRLNTMRKTGSVAWDGAGNARRYTVVRPPIYHGNPEVIDETGTKAAEHMAIAEALRTAEKMLARGIPRKPNEHEAVTLLVKTLRAKS